MTIHITLAPETEARLREKAKALGQEPSSYAARLIDEAVRGRSLDELLLPVRQAFEASGMSEVELSELLEREKHAMRSEKREGGSSGQQA